MYLLQYKPQRLMAIKIFSIIVATATLLSCQLKSAPSENSSALTSKQSTLIQRPLHQSNIPQLMKMMDNKEITATQLTQYYIQQIKKRNSELNAVIAINPKALIVANQLDIERSAGKIRGPLHGIPILVKDNIETKEMATTAGSLALKDNYTRRDAPIIKKLKDAGAIILGKANLSEWANMRSERSSSGWSAVGGQTRNPHDLNRSTCGSSSGSGSAVAAFLSVAAIGTETNGSITCPSSANGIVGIKPTVGLLSRHGIVPISHTQDTAGPMTRSVIDAAILLSVMRGIDKNDSATMITQSLPSYDYVPSKHSASLKGKRIGVLYASPLAHEAVNQLFNKTKKALEKEGAILIEGLKTEPYNNFYQDSYDVLLYEFKHTLNEYFAQLPNQYNTLTLEKVIQFNRDNATQEMPYFQQEVFEKSQAKGELTDKAYLTALKRIRQATRKDGIDQLITTHNLDAIISVTLTPAWSIDRINGDHFTGSFSSYPAISGYPHLTLPMGKVHHMPVGLSLTGSALTEKELINIAYQIEQVIGYQYE
ncbi:amidase [Aliikangiella sp. IMCC44359]|uniref:amidase n=1 Tax=Aliikangiella sp. IMCC44359 TaxID=3459125 RepID=UPI00403AA181